MDRRVFSYVSARKCHEAHPPKRLTQIFVPGRRLGQSVSKLDTPYVVSFLVVPFDDIILTILFISTHLTS